MLVEPPLVARTHIRASGAHPATRPPSPLLWLNLVCLDAPIVAVSWQWLFTRTFHLPFNFTNAAALFLTAWLIYLADRFGDSISLVRGVPRSLRQEFCARHRRGWIVALGVVALTDAGLIAMRLQFRVFAIGAAVGSVALVYLILNHRWSQLWRRLPLKEITIGVLFAAGTVASLLPQFLPLRTFLVASLLFAALCTLNCMCIARWERALDLAQRRGSIATAWPLIAAQVARAALVLAAIAFACLIFDRADAAIYLCVGLSALALAVLDQAGEHLLGDVRTALADLVLLTPLLIVVWRTMPGLSS